MVSAGKEYGGGYQTCDGCENCWQKKKRVAKTQMTRHNKLFPAAFESFCWGQKQLSEIWVSLLKTKTIEWDNTLSFLILGCPLEGHPNSTMPVEERNVRNLQDGVWQKKSLGLHEVISISFASNKSTDLGRRIGITVCQAETIWQQLRVLIHLNRNNYMYFEKQTSGPRGVFN